MDFSDYKKSGIIHKIIRNEIHKIVKPGVLLFDIRKQIEKTLNKKIRTYDQNDLLNSLLVRSKLNDKQVGGKYAATDVTNIALVLGHMQSLSIDKVMPLKINIANGLLITNSYWK